MMMMVLVFLKINQLPVGLVLKPAEFAVAKEKWHLSDRVWVGIRVMMVI